MARGLAAYRRHDSRAMDGADRHIPDRRSEPSMAVAFRWRASWNVALAAQCLSEVRTVVGLDHAATRVMVRVIQLLEHGFLDEDDESNSLLRSEIIPVIASIGPSWPGREIYLRWYLARGVRLVWWPISELAVLIAECLFPKEPTLLYAMLDSL